jgi:hypothetical protein
VQRSALQGRRLAQSLCALAGCRVLLRVVVSYVCSVARLRQYDCRVQCTTGQCCVLCHVMTDQNMVHCTCLLAQGSVYILMLCSVGWVGLVLWVFHCAYADAVLTQHWAMDSSVWRVPLVG